MRHCLDEDLAEKLGFAPSVSFEGFIKPDIADKEKENKGFTDSYRNGAPLHNKDTHMIQEAALAWLGVLKKEHYPSIVTSRLWPILLDQVTFKQFALGSRPIDHALLGCATNPLNHQLICGLFSRGVRNLLILNNPQLIKHALEHYFGVSVDKMSPAQQTRTLKDILHNLETVETYLLDSLLKGMDKLAKEAHWDEFKTQDYDDTAEQPWPERPSSPIYAEDLMTLPTLTTGEFTPPMLRAAIAHGRQLVKEGRAEVYAASATRPGFVINPKRFTSTKSPSFMKRLASRLCCIRPPPD